MTRSPVLLIVFSRPATTQLVFNRIRTTKPPRLYVAADWPRENRYGEKELCDEVRRITAKVDWPCEVKTLFRDKNLGCRLGVQTAIDWFFKHEEKGIILEDDCQPHNDYFRYCSWALDAYRNEKIVWHINGNNLLAPTELYQNDMISFTSLAQVWGWATWRDRWQHYQGNPLRLSLDTDKYVKFWQI